MTTSPWNGPTGAPDDPLKTYTYFWLDGKREVLTGANEADALNRAGYSPGAVCAMDFWANGNCQDYAWNSQARKWIKITPAERPPVDVDAPRSGDS